MAVFARDAWLPGGWAQDVLLDWDGDGTLTRVVRDSERPQDAAQAAGPVIPGMPNVHSHAFQHAMAGLTERREDSRDSFWSWRKTMYRLAQQVTPETLEAIAIDLYIRMLKGGYTSVCEFHYLHHDHDGRPYADAAAMSLCLLRAAERAGIGITLLPTLYQASDFGGVAAAEGQKRFLNATDKLLELIRRLSRESSPMVRIGLALHSLRAVPPASLAAALQGLDAIDARAPIHIHIAEQRNEVDGCAAWSGQRPVAWLLSHAPVDARWCLVHATHLADAEAQAAARSGAVAGLCPTTEADLGDGIFDALRWRAHAGRYAIGSDSHVCVDAAEELRLLEYMQRLVSGRRNVLADAGEPCSAAAMLQPAVDGGAQASGRPIAGLAVGQRADFVVLDAQHPALAGLAAPQMLSAHVFASDRRNAVRDVYVGGVARIGAGVHALQDEAHSRFHAIRRKLFAAQA
jgi:formimidoylglutamate deiminase